MNRRPRAVLAVVAALACVGLAYARVPLPYFLAAFGVAALIPFALDNRTNVWLYLAALGIQMPQDTYHIRFAIADCFLIPAIVYTFLASVRARRWPQRDLTPPLVAVLVVCALAMARALAANGQLSNWALGNKGIGILYLVGGFVALTEQLRTRADLERAVLVFVGGVSVANVIALVAGVGGSLLDFWPDNILFSTAGRLNGWMLNPTSNGSLLMTALLLAVAVPDVARRRQWRWLNLANAVLLIAGIMLSLSRSVWLATGAGAAGFLALAAWRAIEGRRLVSGAQVAAAMLAMCVPIGVMGTLVIAQRQHLRRVAMEAAAEDSAAELRQRLIGTCAAKWDELLCRELRAEVEAVSPSAAGGAVRGGRAAPSTRSRPFTAAKLTDPEGALMNSRGLDDRAAIVRLAWRQYTASWANRIFGIGLGTFYTTSSRVFGVPVIIHSSPVWFLVEFGPFGFAVFVWLLWRAFAAAWRARGALELLGVGLVAALAGWFILSTLNEAFYFRHFWLLLALAGRMATFQRAGQTA